MILGLSPLSSNALSTPPWLFVPTVVVTAQVWPYLDTEGSGGLCDMGVGALSALVCFTLIGGALWA